MIVLTFMYHILHDKRNQGQVSLSGPKGVFYHLKNEEEALKTLWEPGTSG
jgi:hypothetical protein